MADPHLGLESRQPFDAFPGWVREMVVAGAMWYAGMALVVVSLLRTICWDLERVVELSWGLLSGGTALTSPWRVVVNGMCIINRLLLVAGAFAGLSMVMDNIAETWHLPPSRHISTLAFRSWFYGLHSTYRSG